MFGMHSENRTIPISNINCGFYLHFRFSDYYGRFLFRVGDKSTRYVAYKDILFAGDSALERNWNLVVGKVKSVIGITVHEELSYYNS